MLNLKHWYLAARPKTLPAAAAPVIIGTALAFGDGLGHWPSAFSALIIALLIQIGTNLANDYFDFVHGADTSKRIGPMRLTQAGYVTPQTMRNAFILVFTVAFLGGLYLVWRGGWPILFIGLFSILFGIIYTGGPAPLGYLGLGDIFVLVFFGPVAVGGTYYVQTLTINEWVLIAGLPPGLLSTAILVTNNLRDIETDRESGKKTLAVSFGATFSRFEYSVMVVLAILIPLFLYLYHKQRPFMLLVSFMLIAVIPAIRAIFTVSEGQALNILLADTGKILLLYSIVFSLGWLL